MRLCRQALERRLRALVPLTDGYRKEVVMKAMSRLDSSFVHLENGRERLWDDRGEGEGEMGHGRDRCEKRGTVFPISLYLILLCLFFIGKTKLLLFPSLSLFLLGNCLSENVPSFRWIERGFRVG